MSILGLIIDADEMIRDKIKQTLTKHAIQFIEAENGVFGMEKLDNYDIDFVISDLKMKKMNGIQFIDIVQKHNHDIPVIALTESNENSDIISAFRAGAKNVLKKPDKLDELEKIILPIIDIIEKRKSKIFNYKTIRYLTEELNVTNDTSQIPVTVEYLLQHLRGTSFNDRLVGLEIALYEMLANAIEHGNLVISKEEKEEALAESRFDKLVEIRRHNPIYKNRLVRVKFNYNPTQVTISVTDEGEGFEWSKYLDEFSEINNFIHSGRGIFISKTYCDELRYNNKGNQVTLIIRAEKDKFIIQNQKCGQKEKTSAHILVVDNDLNVLRHICSLLTSIGYSYGYISKSQHLFPRLEEELFDLILLNVHMPEIDGTILLKQLNEHIIFRRIPVIMLTEDSNDYIMAICFGAGAEDFIIKPVSELALKTRIQSVLSKWQNFHHIRIVNEKLELLNSELQHQYEVLLKTQEELKNKHLQIQDDIYLAERIQKETMSSLTDVSFLKTSVVFQPHSIVSGDIHYMFKDDAGNVIIFLGDATGHGISAAFLTMMARMGLSAVASDQSPKNMMKNLNRQLASCVPRGDHMTGILLRITSEGVLTGCSAGNPPCVILPANHQKARTFSRYGQALGMFTEERAPYFNETWFLKPGDKVVIFTDGISEWQNSEGRTFGLDNVILNLDANKTQPLDTLLSNLTHAAQEFSNGVSCDDDLTMVGIQFLGNTKNHE